MDKDKIEKLPLTFDVVVLYELITGTIEAFTGIGLITFGDELKEFYISARESGILDSTHNVLVTSLQKVIPYFTDHYLFIGIYLLIVGIIKIVCGFGLANRKRWADYLLVGLLLVFLPIDLFGILNHPSINKIVFILINIVIMLYLVRDKFVQKVLIK